MAEEVTRTGLRYVLITPARNEAKFIQSAIESVAKQTSRPTKWVIVSDGSTDGTDELVRQYEARYEWIELVSKPERKERHFAAKVEAFNAGYARLQNVDYDVIGNLDADISFEDAGYFEFLMSNFVENSKLGVCGTSYVENGVIYPYAYTSLADVFGACQMFRRECFQAIGGYIPIPSGGIDVVAVLSAQARGWQTRTFTEKVCIHHRKVASAQHSGLIRRLFHEGGKDYLLGSHPLWEVARSIYRIKDRPYVLGGVLMFAGYFWSMLRGVQKTMPEDLMQLRREEQMQRLNGILRCFATSRPTRQGRMG
jgi:glycosyltransferase involved in cell wall biosynthesis